MPGPILRGLRFRGSNPASRYIRHVRNLRLSEFDQAKGLSEWREHRFHHRRMERMRSMKMPDSNASRLQLLFERGNRVKGPGYNTQLGRVDRGDGQVRSQQR